MPHDAEHTGGHPLSHTLAFGAMGVAGALAVAPYVLPWFGLGTQNDTYNAENMMHVHEGLGSGLAGLVNTGISYIPLVGNLLATSSVAPIAAISLLGIGGIMLSRWLESRETGRERIRWSAVVRTAALLTSALIALPSLLTGISSGLTYLGIIGLGDATAISDWAQTLFTTLGAAPHSTAGGLISTAIPHLLICGSAVLPLGLSLFMSKSKTPPSQAARLELAHADIPIPGHACELRFRLVDEASGKPLGADALAITHTKRLHSMVIDRTLEDYHHLHPEYDRKTGLFIARFTPRGSQLYRVWNQFTLRGGGQETTQRMDLPALPGTLRRPPRILPADRAEAGGLQLEASSTPPLQQGEQSLVEFHIRGPNGAPAEGLQPIMGAYGHLIGFSEDGEHMMHCHPLPGGDPRQGIVQFHLHPAYAGRSKFFLQINENGREITFPLGQQIRPARQFTDRLTHAPQGGIARSAA